MNILMEIEFDGTDYAGWQIQPVHKTVQGEIEKALKQIIQIQVKVIGASRTDAGVSSLGQIANFHITNYRIESISKLKNSLNSVLPDDIFIKKMKIVPEKFHSRYSPTSKIYEYKILTKPAPLRQKHAWVILYKLDITKMRLAAWLFLKQKDYLAFCRMSDKDGFVKMKSIRIKQIKDEITIRIEANRFLYKMVRRIVGALYEIGRGHRNEQDIKNSLAGKEYRSLMCAPASGLKLIKVKY